MCIRDSPKRHHPVPVACGQVPARCGACATAPAGQPACRRQPGAPVPRAQRRGARCAQRELERG
eukprot:318438-Chlamydomonas_euryale.AAC.1